MNKIEVNQLISDISDDRNDIIKLKSHSASFNKACEYYCVKNNFDLSETFGNSFHTLRSAFIREDIKKAKSIMSTTLGVIKEGL
jgi:hypothetical protein